MDACQWVYGEYREKYRVLELESVRVLGRKRREEKFS